MITINSRSPDGRILKSWPAEVVESSDTILVAHGVFDTEIRHPHLGVIGRGTGSYEYFWPDRWYNVFRFQDPDGTFRNFYCNVTMPPVFTPEAVDYVDLDIDVLVDRHGTVIILDEDEFRANAEKFNYAEDVLEKAAQAVSELKRMIEARDFPFDRKYLEAETNS